jgi:RND family efflux transporter MFP subunit
MSSRILSSFILVMVVIAGDGPAADRPPIVTVARPLECDIADYDFLGRLDPSAEMEVRAPVDGTIDKVAVRPGEAVKKGQLLLEIDARPLREVLQRAEAIVKQDESDLKRRQEFLERGRTLARTVKKDDLKKRADARLPDLQTAMEKNLKLAEAEAKNDPFELRQQGLRRLREALDRQLRLVRARKKEGCDLLFEGDLLDLRRTIEATYRLSMAGGDSAKHKAFDEELRKLHTTIDDLLVVSRASCDKGIDVLAAEVEVTSRHLEGARADAEAARHAVEAATVTVPTAGRVGRLNVKRGDRVIGGSRAATVLCTIVRTDTVRLSFDVDVETMLRLERMLRDGKTKDGELIGYPVRIGLGPHPASCVCAIGLLASPLGQGPWLTTVAHCSVKTALEEGGFPHKGQIDFIDNRIDVKRRQVHVRASFPNAGPALAAEAGALKKLRPVRVRLAIGEPRHVLLVAAAAVTADADEKPIVLVVNDRNEVESRSVTLGPLHEGLQVIETGLKRGDQIILGSERVKRGPADQTLTRDDFARDLRLLGVRPGMVVAPVETRMPVGMKPERRARD